MSRDIAILAERLHDATDRERHEMLRHAAASSGCSRQVTEACLLLATVRAGREPDPPALPDELLAGALSRREVPRAALDDVETVEWLLACLAPPARVEPVSSRASDETRRKMRALVASGRGWPGGRTVWWGGIGLAAAASILGLVFLGPAGEDWAGPLELTRFRAMQMTPEMIDAATTVLEQGAVSPPLFDLPPQLPRRERDAIARGGEPPSAVEPRWEAVADRRPAFHFLGGKSEGAFEVLLLDADHTLLWSRDVPPGTTLVFPDSESPLQPGGLYYWKVNRDDGQRISASSYVGFRVLDEERQALLDDDLSAAGGVAFLRGVAYDRHGLYTAAAAAFDRAALDGPVGEAAARARDDVRRKQGPRR